MNWNNIKRLPPRLIWRIRRIARPLQPLLERMGVKFPPRAFDGKDPFDCVPSSTIGAVFRRIRRNPYLLLQVREVRQILARSRMEYLTSRQAVRKADVSEGSVAHNTLEYNFEGAKSAPDLDRPAIMINVVSAIERVRRNIETLDVLSVGPRSEIEIFALRAAGFSWDRIRALDLFSYSPYVDIGDMHALPYADNSFDIVFLGWVLSYSRDQQRVAEEIVRVCRNRAIVVLAGDYSDETRERATFKNETTHMKNCDQVLALFSGHSGSVFFRHDPDLPSTTMVMTVFEVTK